MAVIIVSADYIGGVIKYIRDKGDVTALRFTHLLNCTSKQLHRYEAGVDLIPRDALKRIFRYAAKMDAVLENE